MEKKAMKIIVEPGDELYHAANFFDQDIRPEMWKLRYLSIISEEGILGNDPSWTHEVYHEMSSGISQMLEDIYHALGRYESDLGKLFHLQKERMKKAEINKKAPVTETSP